MSEKSIGNVFEWNLARRIFRYVRPYRSWFFLALGITVILAILGIARPYLFQYMLDHEVTNADRDGLRLVALFIFILLIAQTLFQYLNSWVTGWLGQSIIHDMRTQVFRHITSLRLRYFDRTAVGTLQTRTISDVETLNDVFSEGMVTIVGELLQVIAIFCIMMYTSWKLTLVVLATLPLLLVATWIFKNKIKVAFQGVRKYVSRMNAFLQEHITGVQVTQIFNREAVESDRFKDLNRKHRNANLHSVLYYSVFFPVVEIISSLAIALLVWYGTGNVLDGQITFGVLVAFIMYIQMFFRPIRMLADRFNTLQLGMVSADRIFQVLDTTDRIESEGGEKASLSGKGAEIEFEKVWFAYTDDEWVLKNVNFHVKPGQKMALVGSTGSGKTTIINLLSRFYEIQRGYIRVNGVEVEKFQKDELRKMIGMVLQDVFLFSGSVLENITLNNEDISKEKAVEAAKMVGAHDFIMRLPGGYDYNVQERGATLSAGQRQLIAFARVLAFNPDILILDEATSSVDSESEAMIQEAIDTVMEGRTSIIIAHRLSTIQKADEIIVLSKGEIIEHGNHQELLRQNGVYKKLYLLQFSET